MKGRLILILFLTLVSLIISSCQKSAEDHYAKALNYEKVKDYQSTIEELNAAIEKNPDFAKAYLERGKIRFTLDYKRSIENLNNSDEAYELSIKDFSEVLKLDNNLRKDALSARGNAYLSLQNYKMALKDFETIIKNDSSDKRIVSVIPLCKIKLNDLDGAKTFIDRMIALNPNDAEHYYGRAVYRLSYFNDKTGGCEDLKRAQELYSANYNYQTKNLKEEIEKLIKINCKE